MDLPVIDATAYALFMEGNIGQSLEMASKGESIIDGKNDDKSKYWMSRFLSLKGSLFNIMGDLDIALDCQKQALEIRNEIGDLVGIADSLSKIALVYKSKNDFVEAEKYLLEAISKIKSSSYRLASHLKAKILLDIVIVYLSLNNLDEASIYSNQIKEISVEIKSVKIKNYYELSHALILKKDLRLVSQAKSFEILKRLVGLKVKDFYMEGLAVFNLCELLIDELKQYANTKILDELVTLIDYVRERAENQNLFPVVIETLILRANMNLVQGNISSTEAGIEQALKLSIEKNLPSYTKRCKEAQLKFYNDLDQWNELVDKGSSILERVNLLKIDDYVKRAKNLAQQYNN